MMKENEKIDLNDENLKRTLGPINFDLLKDMIQDNPLIPTIKGISDFLNEKIEEGYFTSKLFDDGDRSLIEVAMKMRDENPQGDFEKDFQNFKTGHFIYGMLKSLESMGLIQIKKYIVPKTQTDIEKKAKGIWDSYQRKHKKK